MLAVRLGGNENQIWFTGSLTWRDEPKAHLPAGFQNLGEKVLNWKSLSLGPTEGGALSRMFTGRYSQSHVDVDVLSHLLTLSNTPLPDFAGSW